jgi:hypothetical protein
MGTPAIEIRCGREFCSSELFCFEPQIPQILPKSTRFSLEGREQCRDSREFPAYLLCPQDLPAIFPEPCEEDQGTISEFCS